MLRENSTCTQRRCQVWEINESQQSGMAGRKQNVCPSAHFQVLLMSLGGRDQEQVSSTLLFDICVDTA